MKTLKPPSIEATTAATFVLCAFGLAFLVWAALLFATGHPYTALKCVGLSIVVISGCFDPVNCLANFSPFIAGEVVEPSPYAQYFWPCASIGVALLGIGWFGDGWLYHPPVQAHIPG